MIKVEKIHNTAEAFPALVVAMDGYESHYKKRIENKTAELWRINDGESYAITAIEYDETKNKFVFVICCYQGKNVDEFTKYMMGLAKAAECESMRCHVKRKGFLKIAGRLGWQLNEMVLTHGL